MSNPLYLEFFMLRRHATKPPTITIIPEKIPAKKLGSVKFIKNQYICFIKSFVMPSIIEL